MRGKEKSQQRAFSPFEQRPKVNLLVSMPDPLMDIICNKKLQLLFFFFFVCIIATSQSWYYLNSKNRDHVGFAGVFIQISFNCFGLNSARQVSKILMQSGDN